jgi:hypothetical protein
VALVAENIRDRVALFAPVPNSQNCEVRHLAPPLLLTACRVSGSRTKKGKQKGTVTHYGPFHIARYAVSERDVGASREAPRRGAYPAARTVAAVSTGAALAASSVAVGLNDDAGAGAGVGSGWSAFSAAAFASASAFALASTRS